MPITVERIEPTAGLTSGNEIVSLRGELPEGLEVWFGTQRATLETRFGEGGSVVVQVRTPRTAPGLVDITLRAIDEHGESVSGDEYTLRAAFRFHRVPLALESDLTRVVRTLIRELKRQVLANTTISVSIDFPDDPDAAFAKIAEAKLPAIVLSGPRLRENRVYSTNEPGEEVVTGIAGPELR